MKQSVEIAVTGMVQGIGYRPYVARLAEQFHINGTVRNADGIVLITAEGKTSDVDSFVHTLRNGALAGARVDSVDVWEKKCDAYAEKELDNRQRCHENYNGKRTEDDKQSFRIIQSSEKHGEGQSDGRTGEEVQAPMIPIDLPTCPRCEKELFEKDNRRFRYPFISCVACGPRYSIIRKIPYDRENTTMRIFPMCSDCENEYTQKNNIRRHAQTIACHECGPVLKFYSPQIIARSHDTENIERESESLIPSLGNEAYMEAVQLLQFGGILAVKDIGGFHLTCLPDHANTVKKLRLLKGREKKPFAVMFQGVEQVRSWAEVSLQEEHLLTSVARPIVLLKKKADPTGEDNSPYLGAMLPCNPLQIMLIRDCGPLIMTSANVSVEPIITDDKKMIEWFREFSKGSDFNSGFAPEINVGILSHDREILSPLDDSIVRAVRGNRTQMIRRSRGYVPEPIEINMIEDCDDKLNKSDMLMEEKNDSEKDLESDMREIFAAGGDLKSSFCFVNGKRAYMSQYLGDLQDASIMELYENQLSRMRGLFGFQPKNFICDLHPGYFSSRRLMSKNQAMQVQHHHAHIASVIAEHGLKGRTLGIAFDGTGYGTDGTIWGSEFLLCAGATFERVAHLKPVKLIGGDEGSKNAKTICMGFLHNLKDMCEATTSAYINETIEFAQDVADLNQDQCKMIAKAIDMNINTVTSTSMGRLFDCVSALLGICTYNDYEGEAAIELEYEACKALSVKETAKSLGNCDDSDWENLVYSQEAAVSHRLHIPIQEENHVLVGDTAGLLAQILKRLFQENRENVKIEALESKNIGRNRASLALELINAIADWILETVIGLEGNHGGQHLFDQIALSGGTFQNRILLDKTIELLEANGYNVYINEKVPAGDGGLCLGQAYLGSIRALKHDEGK